MNHTREIIQTFDKKPKRAARQQLAQNKTKISQREINRLEKLGRIAAAARILFRRKGYDATTTQEVADRAGIAAGTLFLYAETKEDLLLLAFLGEILDVIEHISNSAPSRSGLTEQALHLLEGIFAYHAEDIDLTRHLMRELSFVRNPQRRSEVGHVVSVAHQKLQTMVEQAQNRGEVDPGINSKDAAEDLFSLFLAPMSAWTNEFMSRDVYMRGLRRSVSCMVKGLAPKVRKLR